jgi:phospholipase C
VGFTTSPPAQGGEAARHAPALAGIQKIRHVIVILQENRSFDSYFGTYPGADGIPSGVCVPDPLRGHCVKPFADHSDRNLGGPHTNAASTADVDGGKMDGFVATDEKGCTNPSSMCGLDAMGYHGASDIPNYWAYAQHFVLEDHMFESVDSWSFPAHLELVSAWSASCKSDSNPMSCASNPMPKLRASYNATPFAWTDLTWLLHKNHVSWGFYLDHGAAPKYQTTGGVPPIWNPLPGFTDVGQDGQEGNVQNLTSFFAQASAGTLPAVSWIVPEPADSEHPPALISRGQAFATGIINAIMKSPDWGSSTIFLSWDDWGGFYDNVVPPKVDALGYGIRVPALIVSPYARQGYIDHQILTSDAYLRFIEDDFLGGARLDPRTDGRPDPRPGVRENLTGNLATDFNFSHAPRPALILNPCPAMSLVPKPAPACNGSVPLHFRSWGDS